MTKTEKLKTRITDLEKDLKKKFSEKDELEKKLADDYAAGSAPENTMRKLSEIRDSISGIKAALKQLDYQLYEIQKGEHIELSRKLDEDTHRKYEEALRSIIKSLKPAQNKLAEIVGNSRLPALTEKLIEACRVEIWECLDEAAQEKYLAIPPMPVKPFPRNKEGVPFNPGTVQR